MFADVWGSGSKITYVHSEPANGMDLSCQLYVPAVSGASWGGFLHPF